MSACLTGKPGMYVHPVLAVPFRGYSMFAWCMCLALHTHAVLHLSLDLSGAFTLAAGDWVLPHADWRWRQLTAADVRTSGQDVQNGAYISIAFNNSQLMTCISNSTLLLCATMYTVPKPKGPECQVLTDISDTRI